MGGILKMDKENAIDYLERKGKLKGRRQLTKDDEEEIEKVMKSGTIYGDPLVELSD